VNKSTPIVAVDLAKNVFEIAVSVSPGRVSERHRVSRSRFLRFFAQRLPSTVLLEACGSAHPWARQIQALGHRVLLLPPHRVHPYRDGNKTDQADTKALLEAYRNKEIHPVPVKTVEQQTLAALHRLRSGWTSHRTARINLVRGILRELGFAIPVGARRVVPKVWELIEDAEVEIPNALRPALAEACLEIRDFEERARAVERQLRALAAQIPSVGYLQSVPGIGLLSSTALVGIVGDIQRFPSGRHFASYLGLTPKEHSSGNQRTLGRINKRGNRYLRTLLVHGARSVLWAAKRSSHPDSLQIWALQVQERHGHNKAVVALANKIARITWSVWREARGFRRLPKAA